jgi:hypothetical protein
MGTGRRVTLFAWGGVTFLVFVVAAVACSETHQQSSPQTSSTLAPGRRSANQFPQYQPGPIGDFYPILAREWPWTAYNQAVEQERFAVNAGDLLAARTYLQAQADAVRGYLTGVSRLPANHASAAPYVQAVEFAGNALAAALQAAVDDSNDANFNGHINAASQAQTALTSAKDQLVQSLNPVRTTTTTSSDTHRPMNP